MIDSRYSGHITVRAGVAAEALAEAAAQRSLVLCARSCLPVLGDRESQLRVVVPRSIEVADIDDLDRRLDWTGHPAIVAIGAGRVTDVAKLLAARNGLPLTVLPAVLSCNAFATEKSVVGIGGRHTTVTSQSPHRVLIDPAVLDRTELRCHLLGVADTLSTYTALFDWELAARDGREQFDPLSAGWARLLHEYAFERLDSLLTSSPEYAYGEIARMLTLSGMLTSFYGSGRPESGSEHCIARTIEQDVVRLGHLWHGEAVLVGILLATALQGQPNAALYRFAAALELGPRLQRKGLTGEMLARYLLSAPFIRDDRFTILDVVTLTARDARKLADDLLTGLAMTPAGTVTTGRVPA